MCVIFLAIDLSHIIEHSRQHKYEDKFSFYRMDNNQYWAVSYN